MHRPQNLWFTDTSSLRGYVRLISVQRVLPGPDSPRLALHGALLLATLLCGALFYLGYRSDVLHWLLLQLPFVGDWLNVMPAVLLPELPLTIYQSLPSLLGGLSVVLFVAVLHPPNLRAWCLALTASIVTLLLFEVTLGYFHWLDVIATLLGLLAGLTIIAVVRCNGKNTRSVPGNIGGMISEAGELHVMRAQHTLFPITAAILFSSFLAVGSTWTDGFSSSECARFSEDGFCEEYKRSAQPVYMSYQNLRNSVQLEAPRAPDRIGRLYLYANFVFLNEINEGIHIIDNSEPTSPVNLGFIRIPGNTEIAIRDNYLYADSYVDLLTLDINDPQNVSVINREQSIFPYDEYQNIPQNISLSDTRIDRDRGVVVSYRLNGS